MNRVPEYSIQLLIKFLEESVLVKVIIILCILSVQESYYRVETIENLTGGSGGCCNVTLPGPSLQTLCSAAEYICFMTALDEAIRSNPIISGNCERITPVDETAEEYDFIVVGGGAGGAVVAGRLSEITKWKILLLEAGKDESAAVQIPGIALALKGSEIDWNYRTINESCACLSTNGSCSISSAKSLGGNTAFNEMAYLRGNPTDYNNWAALGNDGWNWDEVLKYYKKQEDNANINEVGRKYHGTGGPLPVEFFPHQSKFTEAFMTAGKQSGFGVTKDLNGKELTGLSIAQSTQKNGVRVSSSRAYLWPHRHSKNLHILLESHVTKIIIKNKTAVGVEYIKNGKLRSVYAKREVIISTGVVRSPQLLLLSGIGPKDHLKSKGIKMVSDLPGVGENFHDHSSFAMTFTINQTDTYDNNILTANEYLQNQSGLLSTFAETYFIGAGCTEKTSPDYPDVQLNFLDFNLGCAPGGVGALRSSGRRQITAFIVIVHPKSRGRVSLASNNPIDQPVLWGNYLGSPSDIEVILDGIEMALKFAETESLQKYKFTLDTEPLKVCSNYSFRSRDYWTCAIRQEATPWLHPVGSCKMGPASDPMAVVDSKLRVRGIKSLRIVDASVMPQITSANTAAPTMMIGERGADFIKRMWLPTCG